ncbi:MAG: tetratricopeptide repeat protein [Phycisphaerae bacterium]|jgi:tetratricopeptide (TPR) repeat protein
MKKLKLKPKNTSSKVRAFEFHAADLLLLFCIFCLFNAGGYAQDSSGQSVAEADKRQNSFLISKSPTTELGRQLWRARIENPEDRDSSKSKNELFQIIEKIHSVRFEPQYKAVEPNVVVESAKEIKPDETSSGPNAPREVGPKKVEVKPESPFSGKRQNKNPAFAIQITDQTLEIFERLSQQPQQIKNPLELAEILFRNGNLKEAAKCYKEALGRMTANENSPQEEKAWILFQIGNCLRNTDQPAAIEMYRQLIAEYPDSPWADLAKAQSKLIDWYLQDKPVELVAENRP